MLDIPEIIRWLQTLDHDSAVGVDEGGLTLVEISTPKDKPMRRTEAYLNIGGIPAHLEE